VHDWSQFFTRTDYVLTLPMTLLSLFALGILIIDLMLPREWKRVNAYTALVGIVFSAAALLKIQLSHFADGTPLLGAFGLQGSMRMDAFAVYFSYLFLAGAFIAILMSVRYMEIEAAEHGEFYSLILFSVVGMMCMACGYDLVLLYIGLETMAIPTYVLVGFLRNDRRSNEAALKYMLLGAFSSGIFAYGLSLMYGLSGSTRLVDLSQALSAHMVSSPHDPVAVVALVTVMTGLLFKVAAFPFHMWAPDVYEGAPTSITGFMSVAAKSAAWALMLRVLLIGVPALRPIYVPLLVFVAITTMSVGNLTALAQNNTKRLLAYSSIAHVGYMILGLIAGSKVAASSTGVKGIMMYLLVYTFMNLGAFAVITSLRRRDIIGDEIDDLSGLFFKAPAEAMLLLVFLLSLAGIPPMAGFWGKYFIFLSLIETGHYGLALIGVLYSVISLYYYARMFNAAFMRKPVDAEAPSTSPSLGIALAITGAATLVIGVFPQFFIEAANWSVGLSRVSQPFVSWLH
jgi:NADH-quinone oxidoreductase subunit N